MRVVEANRGYEIYFCKEQSAAVFDVVSIDMYLLVSSYGNLYMSWRVLEFESGKVVAGGYACRLATRGYLIRQKQSEVLVHVVNIVGCDLVSIYVYGFVVMGIGGEV